MDNSSVRLRSLFLLAVIACVAGLRGDDTPAMPPGLEWRAIPEIKGKLLVPAGWHFSDLSSSSAERKYRITKSVPGKNGSFETGLVLTVKIRPKDGSADQQAQAFVHRYLADGSVLQPFFEEDFGSMKAYGGVVSGNSSGRSLTYAVNAVANPTTNTLYLFVFQTPAETFDEDWKIGQWLIGRFKLDDEV